MRQVLNCKLSVAYKRPLNLQDMIVHSQLTGFVSKCNKPRCSHCSSIAESNSFLSTTASANFSVREIFICASSDVIYLITCMKFNLEYVGQKQQKCNQRINKHKFDIKRYYPDILTTVSEHFNLPGHQLKIFIYAH